MKEAFREIRICRTKITLCEENCKILIKQTKNNRSRIQLVVEFSYQEAHLLSGGPIIFLFF